MIRLASEIDREQILDLFQIMWTESESWIPKRLQLPSLPEEWRDHFCSLTSNPEVTIAVFEKDGSILGAGCLKKQDHIGLISDVVVHPDHRRHGIGSRLVEWLEAEAFGTGAAAIDVEVAEGNSASILYDKVGYEPIVMRMRKFITK